MWSILKGNFDGRKFTSKDKIVNAILDAEQPASLKRYKSLKPSEINSRQKGDNCLLYAISTLQQRTLKIKNKAFTEIRNIIPGA